MTDEPTNENITVRQRFDEQLAPREIPVIRVTPVERTVACEVGRTVVLTCTVQSGFSVRFEGVPDAGKGQIP